MALLKCFTTPWSHSLITACAVATSCSISDEPCHVFSDRWKPVYKVHDKSASLRGALKSQVLENASTENVSIPVNTNCGDYNGTPIACRMSISLR